MMKDLDIVTGFLDVVFFQNFNYKKYWIIYETILHIMKMLITV